MVVTGTVKALVDSVGVFGSSRRMYRTLERATLPFWTSGFKGK